MKVSTSGSNKVQNPPLRLTQVEKLLEIIIVKDNIPEDWKSTEPCFTQDSGYWITTIYPELLLEQLLNEVTEVTYFPQRNGSDVNMTLW